jgi:hypothetical protein
MTSERLPTTTTRLINAVHDHLRKRLLFDPNARRHRTHSSWEESADFEIRYKHFIQYTYRLRYRFSCKYLTTFTVDENEGRKYKTNSYFSGR